MKIDEGLASKIVREEAAAIAEGIDETWAAKVEEFSKLCTSARTHIAFLGTAMIAKATNLQADLFAVKPEHAGDNPNSFSARTLSENVLVPLSAEIGFNLGTTGRQPLNNQPYFRMKHLDDGTPMRKSSVPAFRYMLTLVKELSALKDAKSARAALRAYIAVRKRYQPKYVDHSGTAQIKPEQLINAIITFVRQDSEGGKRAQAIVAGLLDVFAGVECVESGRINDPSRHYPGDVCIRANPEVDDWEKAFEVRDKPVSASDVQIFGKKCIDMGVREAAVVMVSDKQESLNVAELSVWASGFGLGLTLFKDWPSLVDQVLFWAKIPKPAGAIAAARFIYDRLLVVETSPAGVALWNELMGAKPSA